MENMELLKATREMMETQIGSLAFKIDANRGEMKANQVKAEAKRKAERKADQEMMEANHTQMEESLKEPMRLTVSFIEEKMEAIVHSILSERDENVTE
jgi:actin-like ATPase involved in cell morphogenesis